MYILRSTSSGLKLTSPSLNWPHLGKDRSDCESETVQYLRIRRSSAWRRYFFLVTLAMCIFCGAQTYGPEEVHIYIVQRDVVTTSSFSSLLAASASRPPISLRSTAARQHYRFFKREKNTISNWLTAFSLFDAFFLVIVTYLLLKLVCCYILVISFILTCNEFYVITVAHEINPFYLILNSSLSHASFFPSLALHRRSIIVAHKRKRLHTPPRAATAWSCKSFYWSLKMITFCLSYQR